MQRKRRSRTSTRRRAAIRRSARAASQPPDEPRPKFEAKGIVSSGKKRRSTPCSYVVGRYDKSLIVVGRGCSESLFKCSTSAAVCSAMVRVARQKPFTVVEDGGAL